MTVNHTLVTMIGKAGKQQDRPGYRRVTYRFPDGREEQTVFFGLALARQLRPDDVVILGTTASHWSVLAEHLVDDIPDEQDARLELLEAEERKAVTQELLDRLAPLMTRQAECRLHPRLIPFGKDAAEQYAILKIINETVPDGELSFDVTHGFRHFGMVGFLSSSMLEQMRRLEVRGLWYGALDMTDDGVTPVLQLDGLMGIRRWVGALERFDATGDYGVFASLLHDDVAQDKIDCLCKAAFLERTLNVRDAARAVETFLQVLNEPLPSVSELFRDQLAERLEWVRKSGLAERCRALAEQHLKRDDFVRAAMFGKEGCVARMLEGSSVTIGDYPARKEAIEQAEARLAGSKREAYWALTHLRNALAHGTPPPKSREQRALREPDTLRRALADALRKFFG